MPKATGMIGRNEIRDGEIITEHLAADAVTAAKLADNAVVAANIANSTITLAKLGGNIIKEDTITLTNAEILALATTPKTLVAAGGAGTVHIVIGALLESLASGGAYVPAGGDDFQVKYTDASGAAASGAIETTGVIDSTSQKYSYAPGIACIPVANAALVLDNIGSNVTGGAAANTMRLKIRYYTLTL